MVGLLHEMISIFRGDKTTYTIEVDGVVVHTATNNNPEEFTNVTVHASNPWSTTANVDIRNLVVSCDIHGN